MLTAHLRKSAPLLSLLVSFVICACSHQPFIKAFDVSPRVITAGDTVKLDMDINGKPTILYHETMLSDSVKLLEFTLVVSKNGKDSSRFVQVEVHPGNSSTPVSLPVTGLSANKDTLIAAGVKAQRWSGFEVVSASSAFGRDLMVSHENRMIMLNKNGTPSNAFANTNVAGRWILKTLLTAEEKADLKKAPKELQINLTIKSKKE